MKILIQLLLLVLLFSNTANAQLQRETRALWVATNYRLDWLKSNDPEAQKQRFLEIIEYCKRNNLNTILLQVRSNSSVIFNSTYEPYSPYLTGQLGQSPSYDPLQFAINQARKNGIQIFAWLNTIRCFIPSADFDTGDSDHLFKNKKEWMVKIYKNERTQYWLDPGLPEVREYLVNVIDEMLMSYDVDGIVLDFMRYPGRIFDDSFSYSIYGKNLSRDEYRRSNINDFLSRLNSLVRTNYPEKKITVTPIGMNSSIGLNKGGDGYSQYYQDVTTWIEKDWVDYLMPQIYWDSRNEPKFEKVLTKWVKYIGAENVVPALAAYKPEIKNELEHQISIGRKHDVSGVSLYRYSNVSDIRINSFDEYALPSLAEELDNIDPLKPAGIKASINESNPQIISINWQNVEAEDKDLPSYIGLFRDEKEKYRFIKLFPPDSEELTLRIDKPNSAEYKFALQSYDNLWNASGFSEIITLKPPLIAEMQKKLKPISKPVMLPNNNSVILFSDQSDEMLIQQADKSYNEKIIPGINVINMGAQTFEGKIKIKLRSNSKTYEFDHN